MGKTINNTKIDTVWGKKTEPLYLAKDLEGGGFGEDRAYTIDEWLEQAIDWCEADGADTVEYWKNIRRLRHDFKDEEILDTIADIWQLEFTKVELPNRWVFTFWADITDAYIFELPYGENVNEYTQEETNELVRTLLKAGGYIEQYDIDSIVRMERYFFMKLDETDLILRDTGFKEKAKGGEKA